MRVCWQVAHQTVSGAPGPYTNEPATLENLPGELRYNSLNCSVCTGHVWWASGATTTARQWSIAKVYNEEQCVTKARAQKSEVTGHVRCGTGLSGVAPDCPVWHRTVRCSYRTRVPTVIRSKTPTGVLRWRAPDIEQCLSDAPPDCLVCPSPAETTKG
jgi:hypothetical protein